jgi:hypothetical protein
MAPIKRPVHLLRRPPIKRLRVVEFPLMRNDFLLQSIHSWPVDPGFHPEPTQTKRLPFYGIAVCPVCKEPFPMSSRTRTYCSTTCHDDWMGRNRLNCPVCGERFKSSHQSCCSRECAEGWAIINPREKKPPTWKHCKVPWRTCRTCLIQFISRPDVSFCSPACKAVHYKPPASRVRWNECKRCETTLLAQPGEHRNELCDDCRPLSTVDSRRRAKAKRRAILKGVSYEPFDSRDVYENDSWICQLCETPVDQDADPNTDWAPSIDHTIPLSKGGPHERSNVRTAHRLCNSRKNAGKI